MKYVQINSVPYGSTGGIMMRLHEDHLAAGNESWVMWGRGRLAKSDREFKFGTKASFYLDAFRTRLDDRAGFHSKIATKCLLSKLNEINPDVVHLHNIHGYYINIEMLFEWLAAHHCHVNWTLHDCWAFTGHCAHFIYAGCDQWKSGCSSMECPQKSEYPKTAFRSASSRNYADKRRLFNLLPANRMTLITPSEWLAGLVRESFLSKYPIEVRYNTVDTRVFKSAPSDFRQRNGLGGKYIVLGVASPWTEHKGLQDFLRLAQDLDERFAVVLVGLTKGQLQTLPSNVLGLERTDSPQKLAEIYTAADVFFNPSLEETFGLTLLEAHLCGASCLCYSGGACDEVCRFLGETVVDSYAAALSFIRKAAIQ